MKRILLIINGGCSSSQIEEKNTMKIIPFDELSTSTATIMVYSNVTFDISALFHSIPITFINAPFTKKKKNIDKKKLKAPYGAIISLQHGVYVRGIRMSKKKKYWCPVCQLYDGEPDKDGSFNTSQKKILSVEEVVLPMSKAESFEKRLPFKTCKIHFICQECKREFDIRQLRKIVPFLNQVTIVISIGDVIVNVMLFKDNIKLAGNRCFDNSIEAIMILWENYIGNNARVWSFREIRNSETGEMEIAKDVHFLFDLVMKNVVFKLGFPIDKKKLNQVMNRKEYREYLYLSHWESTSATHVNIKMFTRKPEYFEYEMLVYYGGGVSNSHFMKMREKKYALNKTFAKKFITFIVFSSAETILTGRYNQNVKDQYEFFIKTVNKHRAEIEEFISKPEIPIRHYLNTIDGV